MGPLFSLGPFSARFVSLLFPGEFFFFFLKSFIQVIGVLLLELLLKSSFLTWWIPIYPILQGTHSRSDIPHWIIISGASVVNQLCFLH